MEYIKVPYVRLRGKKYGGDLTPEEAESVTNFYSTNVGDGSSEAYGGTFQELYKAYKSGEDPAADSESGANRCIVPERRITSYRRGCAIRMP